MPRSGRRCGCEDGPAAPVDSHDLQRHRYRSLHARPGGISIGALTAEFLRFAAAGPRFLGQRGIVEPGGTNLDFGGVPCEPRSLAPDLGEHTRAILAELGRDQAAIDALYESGTAQTRKWFGESV